LSSSSGVAIYHLPFIFIISLCLAVIGASGEAGAFPPPTTLGNPYSVDTAFAASAVAGFSGFFDDCDPPVPVLVVISEGLSETSYPSDLAYA
jgi:hypothetical protein